MKGFLRLYEDGIEIKSKLYWCAIRDCYLNFYKDKKNQVPSSILNLEECAVSKVFNEKYNTDLIQIKTPYKTSILLIPENIKDFDKWESCLIGFSLKGNSTPRKEKTNLAPRNIRNMENDEYNPPVASQPLYAKPTKRFSEDSNEDQPKRFVKHYNGHPRRVESNIRHTSISNDNEEYYRRPSTPTTNLENKKYVPNLNRQRGISTVKEDPMMNDNEILETKTLNELRKKYPISDKTKRWSIAATDLVGKSNDELFIMLIQLNREKSHMDIWKDTLENRLSEINEALENTGSAESRDEMENSREYILNQLIEIEYMINLAHPLVSFLESVVKMSDVYQGDNQTFHVVYHQQSPSGKEDFSNIDFLRRNQEREVAKLINENQNISSCLYNNTLKGSSRSLGNSGKENDPELASNLRKSQKFVERKKELTDVLDDIEIHLTDFVPIRNSLEEFIANINPDKTDFENKNKPNLSIKLPIKNVKSQKPNKIKMNDLSLMPRRSTRKAPKSDMTASLNRSERLNRQPLTPQLSHQGAFSSQSLRTKSKEKEKFNSQQSDGDLFAPLKFNHSSHSLNEPKYRRTSNSSQDVNDSAYIPESRLQNKLRELINDDFPVSSKNDKAPKKREPFDLNDGPLIKLNVDRYQNINRPNRGNVIESSNYSSNLRGSLSNSDISVDSNLIKQRMNLNESFDNDKMWKNPGKVYGESHFSSPEKVDIKERYRYSPYFETDVDPDRSNRIRSQIIKESISSYPENQIGERSEREEMLKKNAMLAQEASRRSRQL